MLRKNYYAFFDVDGTITHKTTMLSYLEYSLPKYYGALSFLGKLKLNQYYLERKLFSKGKDRYTLNKEYYQVYKGMDREKLLEIGREWFLMELKRSSNFFNQNVLKALEQHQNNGAKIVFVSGGFQCCIEPIAEHLGVKDTLCVIPYIKNGKFTGEIKAPQTIGSGKADAMELFLKTQEAVNLKESFAYGDHISDLDMLNMVGNPVVVRGDALLEQHAKEKNWQII
jgi:HAD superfamily hydrolase (TIGR01490 family)